MSRSPSQQRDLAEADHDQSSTSAPQDPAQADHQPSKDSIGDDAQVAPGDAPGEDPMSGPGPDTYETEVKEQDRWLPIANVARIMKTALPDNAKIAKEAKECMQECVSEFISFITSEASEKCQVEKRKTVNGEDILFAMFSLGFENYSEALKIYLARYRESNMTRNDNQGRPTSGHGMGGGSADPPGDGTSLAARPGDADDAPTQAFGFPV